MNPCRLTASHRVYLALILLVCLPLGTMWFPADLWAQDKFHHVATGPKIDYEALMLEATPLADSDRGQEVWQACLDAYGGRENLMKLEGCRLHYTFQPKGTKETIPTVKAFASGRRYRVEQGEDGRYLNGLTCWYTRGDQVAELDGGRYRSELFSYLTLAMPLAGEIENFASIKFGTLPDDPLNYLYFDKPDSVLVILGIDADNRIAKSTGVVRQGDQSFTFINEFADYRQVDGYWLPHHLKNISMGLFLGDSVLDKVEINPEFPQGYFTPEKSGN